MYSLLCLKKFWIWGEDLLTDFPNVPLFRECVPHSDNSYLQDIVLIFEDGKHANVSSEHHDANLTAPHSC